MGIGAISTLPGDLSSKFRDQIFDQAIVVTFHPKDMTAYYASESIHQFQEHQQPFDFRKC